MYTAGCPAELFVRFSSAASDQTRHLLDFVAEEDSKIQTIPFVSISMPQRVRYQSFAGKKIHRVSAASGICFGSRRPVVHAIAHKDSFRAPQKFSYNI
jgi:hypothetical protein